MRIILVIPIIFLLISACSNEEVSPTDPILSLVNLKVGNYWIYDWYEIDVNGTVTFLNRRDSMIIEKDTVVNGHTCFIKKGNFYGSKLISKTILFDSMNTIYTYPDKEVLLTLDQSISVTKKFGDETSPIAIGYYSFDDNEVSIEVPAGIFQTVNFKGRIESQRGDYPYGVRYNHNYYADNVGLITVRTQLYSSPNDIEMRLVRYGSVN